MSIANFSVTRPVTVIMRIAALTLLGFICVLRLPVDLLPKVDIPTVAVSTSWPNVAPEEIEAQVTRPIEQALSSTPNLYAISSTTSGGSSSVRVQFNWGTDIGQAAIDVMQRVERAKRSFPTDPTLQNPAVTKFDPNQTPILILGVFGEKDPVKLRTMLDNQVSPIVESANGVASATVSGGMTRAVVVNVDPVRLHARHLALADVIRRLVQENINAPAGIARQSDTEYTIRSLGWIVSPAQLRDIPIAAPNGQIIKLSDVADVQDSHQEQRVFTRMNGQPAAGLIITRQSDANTIATVKAVMDRLQLVNRMYPNLQFKVAYDQSHYIQNSVNDLLINAIIGGTLAVLILLFFLRNVKSTLVVALSIPTSIISTFALLYVCGFTLNTMSLSGLALATGLIVDDAVVVLENIFRHLERDKVTPREAAIRGTDEILSAVFASTWTVMVVFLPLFLIKGQAGQMYTQFALVVIFSLAISLLDACTVVPMLATRLISGEAHTELMNADDSHPSLLTRLFVRFGVWFTALDETYRKALGWALRHRAMTVGGALVFTALAFLLVPLLGTELMPATDSGDLSLSVKLPPGTALAKTDKVMRQIEGILLSNPNIDTVFAGVGGGSVMRGGGGASVPFQGSCTVRLKPDHTEATLDIIDDLNKKLRTIPGVRPNLRQNDLVSMLMTGGDNGIDINIFGQDLSTLSALSREMMRRVNKVPGFENVDVNWQEAMPEIQWSVDRQKAAQLGVTFEDVSDTLNTATNGSIASYYQEKGFQYPIIVQLPEAERKTIETMSNLVVRPGIGTSDIVLRQVATPVIGNGPSQITRQDRQRYIQVSGTPQGRSSGDVQKDLQRALADMSFPSGYYWDWGISQKRQAEEFGMMNFAVILAIGLIYMLLASQFESLLHPLAILVSVPLAATGVILGLFLTGRSFGLTALIGVLMLVGIVVKNGILLVDYTNTLRKRGYERNNAVLVASPTRLRPILMTASAAVLGMLPVAIGFGKGSEIQAPMATAVIGGLTTSTLLTLFVVPVVYTLLDDLSGGRRRANDAASETPGDALAGEQIKS